MITEDAEEPGKLIVVKLLLFNEKETLADRVELCEILESLFGETAVTEEPEFGAVE